MTTQVTSVAHKERVKQKRHSDNNKKKTLIKQEPMKQKIEVLIDQSGKAPINTNEKTKK